MRIPLNKLQTGFDDIDFNTFQQLEKTELSETNPKTVIEFKKYNRYDNEFKSGYNKEAEMITFPNNESFEKLSLSVNLFTASDMSEKRKNRLSRNKITKTLETLEERGNKNRSGLSVFINGKKN